MNEPDRTYHGEQDLKARIDAALKGVTVAPLEPSGSIPRLLMTLQPYKAPPDLGILQATESAGNAFLKGVPARVVCRSPIDRMGMYYGITVAFLDTNLDLHSVEVDVTKDAVTPAQFANRLVGLAEHLARDFAAAYVAAAPKQPTATTPATVAPAGATTVKPATSTEPPKAPQAKTSDVPVKA
jgi:hypothetical protein